MIYSARSKYRFPVTLKYCKNTQTNYPQHEIMIEKQLDELFPEMTLTTNSRVRKKCWVVYLRKKGHRREEVAELLRIDDDTVTNYTKNCLLYTSDAADEEDSVD